jgi:CRISPR/Cas system CMR subunit Cmr4 (Cas7 group RAMP superfamily)
MKKEEVPQDTSALVGVTRDVCYVKDTDGKYTTDLSIGWDVKKQALDNAWEDINERVKEAAQLVKAGEKSPIYYFMELKLMDLPVLSGYTGFWQFTIKRHFKPSVFKNLNEKQLLTYSKAFDITIDELKNFNG